MPVLIKKQMEDLYDMDLDEIEVWAKENGYSIAIDIQRQKITDQSVILSGTAKMRMTDLIQKVIDKIEDENDTDYDDLSVSEAYAERSESNGWTESNPSQANVTVDMASYSGYNDGKRLSMLDMMEDADGIMGCLFLNPNDEVTTTGCKKLSGNVFDIHDKDFTEKLWPPRPKHRCRSTIKMLKNYIGILADSANFKAEFASPEYWKKTDGYSYLPLRESIVNTNIFDAFEKELKKNKINLEYYPSYSNAD